MGAGGGRPLTGWAADRASQAEFKGKKADFCPGSLRIEFNQLASAVNASAPPPGPQAIPGRVGNVRVKLALGARASPSQPLIDRFPLFIWSV